MAVMQKIMKAKLNRMMHILNSNTEGRIYRVKCIDWGDSGYLQISPFFDVEISPSTLRDRDVANVFLWRLYYDEKGRACTQEIASVRYVSFEDVDGIVGKWIDELNRQTVVAYMKPMSLSEVYAYN